MTKSACSSRFKTTDAGYRIYDDDALNTLQQILFFRELGFPLLETKEIMHNPCYDRTKALEMQKDLLLRKRKRLDGVLALIERILKGDTEMSFKEFDRTEIAQSMADYSAEARERWGSTDAYAECETKTAGYDAGQWELVSGEGADILKGFAERRGLPPDSSAVQTLVTRWQNYITARFYTCTDEILLALGETYTEDERFAGNIDQHGEGTACFMSEAIRAFCS